MLWVLPADERVEGIVGIVIGPLKPGVVLTPLEGIGGTEVAPGFLAEERAADEGAAAESPLPGRMPANDGNEEGVGLAILSKA